MHIDKKDVTWALWAIVHDKAGSINQETGSGKPDWDEMKRAGSGSALICFTYDTLWTGWAVGGF